MIDGKYRINGLSREQRTPMSEDNKNFLLGNQIAFIRYNKYALFCLKISF